MLLERCTLKDDFPSWGYMVRQNSTTVWEHWEYMNGPGMNSHNHPALASVGAWFFRWLAGEDEVAATFGSHASTV